VFRRSSAIFQAKKKAAATSSSSLPSTGIGLERVGAGARAGARAGVDMVAVLERILWEWWRILGESRDITMLLERRHRILLLLAILIPECLLHRTVWCLCHLHLQCSLTHIKHPI